MVTAFLRSGRGNCSMIRELTRNWLWIHPSAWSTASKPGRSQTPWKLSFVHFIKREYNSAENYGSCWTVSYPGDRFGNTLKIQNSRSSSDESQDVSCEGRYPWFMWKFLIMLDGVPCLCCGRQYSRPPAVQQSTVGVVLDKVQWNWSQNKIIEVV